MRRTCCPSQNMPLPQRSAVANAQGLWERLVPVHLDLFRMNLASKLVVGSAGAVLLGGTHGFCPLASHARHGAGTRSAARTLRWRCTRG